MNTWFISDTHFFHQNILGFTGSDGKPIRPGWASVEEMNEAMVDRWNAVVKPEDTVWHLGDVAFKVNERAADLDILLGRLKGKKNMLLGNHDNLGSEILRKHFAKIELWKAFPKAGFTCTHIPIRLDMMRDTAVNVHGHIHQNMMTEKGYINVSVEVRDFTPVHMDQIIQEVADHV